MKNNPIVNRISEKENELDNIKEELQEAYKEIIKLKAENESLKSYNNSETNSVETKINSSSNLKEYFENTIQRLNKSSQDRYKKNSKLNLNTEDNFIEQLIYKIESQIISNNLIDNEESCKKEWIYEIDKIKSTYKLD